MTAVMTLGSVQKYIDYLAKAGATKAQIAALVRSNLEMSAMDERWNDYELWMAARKNLSANKS